MTLDSGEVGVSECEENPEDQLLTWKELLMKTLRILIPTDVSSFLWLSTQTITVYYVGKYHHTLGTAQYSASIIIFNMCAFSIVMGFGAAIDTLSSQAFGANPLSPEVGETLQMALALNFALGIIFSVFFLSSKPVVCSIFEKDVCDGVAQFLRYAPPYLFAQIVSGIMSKTMYAQRLPEVVAAANAVAALTSPITNYYFTPLGIHGAAIALGTTVGFCAITHILCAFFHPKVIIRYAPWPSPKLHNVAAWKTFFRVGVPALVATCAEWWAFEIQTVIASKISTTALAVHGVGMNLVSLLFSVSVGMSVAASVIVGNAIGAGKPRQARQFAHFVILCDVAVGTVTAMMMLLFGSHIAHFYGSDEGVVQGVLHLIPLVALCHAGDSVQFCLQGVFRGVGRPFQGGVAVLLTLWCVGVPSSLLLVFVLKVGVYGCIGGIVVGMACEIPLLVWWMLHFDWAGLAAEARASQGTALAATDVAMVDSFDDDEEAEKCYTASPAAHSHCSSFSCDRCRGAPFRPGNPGEFERELHERTPSILEEVCCSLHNSFVVPPRNFHV